jgi:hypothetical protein
MEKHATVMRDKIDPNAWRVEKIVEDGAVEVAIFAGPDSRRRAERYATAEYGQSGWEWFH